jgi:hypothetical protein
LTRTAHRILHKSTQAALFAPKSYASSRQFSASVTYDFKDLILDPEQKGKPIYQLHLLD